MRDQAKASASRSCAETWALLPSCLPRAPACYLFMKAITSSSPDMLTPSLLPPVLVVAGRRSHGTFAKFLVLGSAGIGSRAPRGGWTWVFVPGILRPRVHRPQASMPSALQLPCHSRHGQSAGTGMRIPGTGNGLLLQPSWRGEVPALQEGTELCSAQAVVLCRPRRVSC